MCDALRSCCTCTVPSCMNPLHLHTCAAIGVKYSTSCFKYSDVLSAIGRQRLGRHMMALHSIAWCQYVFTRGVESKLTTVNDPSERIPLLLQAPHGSDQRMTCDGELPVANAMSIVSTGLCTEAPDRTWIFDHDQSISIKKVRISVYQPRKLGRHDQNRNETRPDYQTRERE